jgi:hypothetical protein
VGYEQADLLEVRIPVEEELDAFARGQFSLFVLASDALGAAPLKQFVLKGFEFLHKFEEMRAVG